MMERILWVLFLTLLSFTSCVTLTHGFKMYLFPTDSADAFFGQMQFFIGVCGLVLSIFWMNAARESNKKENKDENKKE